MINSYYLVHKCLAGGNLKTNSRAMELVEYAKQTGGEKVKKGYRVINF